MECPVLERNVFAVSELQSIFSCILETYQVIDFLYENPRKSHRAGRRKASDGFTKISFWRLERNTE